MSEWSSETWATIAAILAGPILAVLVTRFVDQARAAKERKLFVFRQLMRTRRLRLHPDHVGALNMIDVDFHKDKQVMAAFTEYINHLHEGIPADEGDNQDRFFKRREDLLTKLLKEIGSSLNYSLDRADIDGLGYSPVAGKRTKYVKNETHFS
jgi:hypothetical protein